MESRFSTRTVLIILAVAALVTPILTSLGQVADSDDQKKPIAPTPLLSDLKKNFRSVEYQTGFNTDSNRRRKSAKYDKYRVLDPTITEDTQEVSFADWLTSTTALPIAESDVVLLGKIIDSTAFLSNNKNSVYSEFKIEIERIFKNSSNAPIEEQKYLRAERDGGIVIFPNGFKTWYFVSGQSMPSTGERYLFFLTHDFPLYGDQDKDLYLLTAYDLKDGIVHPLDFASGGTHPIATKYRGKDEPTLLAEVEKALKAINSSTRRP